MTEAGFDPARALRTLLEHGVEFVLIGGLAGRVYGSTTVTNDVDICYSREDENLRRLAAALRELKARLRGAPLDAPFLLDAETLKRGDHFTFSTDAGGLDLIGSPAGVSSFDSGKSPFHNLQAAARQIDLSGAKLKVASIDDLIVMKRAAGRTKDLLELENLGALRDVLDENPDLSM